MQSDEMLKSQGLPQGFVWGAVKAGIKASGNADVAIAVAAKGANSAVMFTIWLRPAAAWAWCW
jgi:glutamate N-acetyltransferase/amino-acid N-acetyltransferase